MIEAIPGVLCAAACLFAGRWVVHRRRERALASAGVSVTRDARPLRVRGGWRWLVLPGSVLAWVLGGAVAGLPGSLAAAIAVVVAPRIVRRRCASRRTEALESELSDAVTAIAAAMRSGHSVMQSIAHAAGEVNAPLAPALTAVTDRVGFGVPLDTSLDRLVEELPSPDVRLAAGVLRLHRRTSAALPGVLDQVARTLRERRAAAREIRSLTAQARLSAVILGLLPIGFFLFLSATSRENIADAYHSATGATAIGLGLVLQCGAYLWIRRLLQVEI